MRARVRGEAEGRQTPQLHADLARLDPAAAARLRPSDRQRVLRALEVLHATGRSLTAFQNRRGEPALAAGEWRGLFLAPEREALKRRIAAALRGDAGGRRTGGGGAASPRAASIRRCR